MKRDSIHQIRILYPAVTISYLAYAMMATLFVPMLVTSDSGYLPQSDSLARRTAVVGLLLMLYPLGQFFGNPILGALSDRVGRRKILLFSVIGAIFCYFGISFALTLKDLTLLAPFLLLCGVTEANLAISLSSIADLVPPDRVATYYGRLFALTSAAYSLGPLGGGILAVHFGYAFPFWVVTFLIVIAGSWIFFGFSETLPLSQRVRTPTFGMLRSFSEVFKPGKLRQAYLANFLIFIAAMGFWRVITIYLVDEWGLNVGSVVLCYTPLAISAGVANIFVMPWLNGRFSPTGIMQRVAGLSSISIAACVFPIGSGRPLIPVLIAASFASAFLALGLSAASSLVSELTPESGQGAALGNNAALLVLGEVIGVSGGSFIAGVDSAVPMIAFSILCGSAVLVLRLFFRKA